MQPPWIHRADLDRGVGGLPSLRCESRRELMSVERLDDIRFSTSTELPRGRRRRSRRLRLENLDTDIPPLHGQMETTQAAIGEEEANSCWRFELTCRADRDRRARVSTDS